jgi:FAD-dependent urate hydroxylase
MRAVIVGAGICGPVAAMALGRAGIAADIFESHQPAATDVGSYLTVATNGLDALRAIEAHGSVLEHGFPTERTVLFSGTGRRLGDAPAGSTRAGHDVSHTIKRAQLHRALRDEAARRGIALRAGKRLIGADAIGSRVRARFADGSHTEADLLIGCDGVHSTVRSIIDAAAPRPRYVGLLNFGGYTPGRVAGESRSWRMMFGARAFFGYVPDQKGGTVWFANVPRHAVDNREREATTADQWRQWLIELFADDHGPAVELIREGVLELAADNTHDLPRVPVWHKHRTIIIGDAAHAPSPSSGQGASMAIEDGILLAMCLRDLPTVEAAFAAFERARRTRVERIVAQGARSSSSKAAGPLGRVIRDVTMPFILRRFVTERSMAWMYEHHIDWHKRLAPASDAA